MWRWCPLQCWHFFIREPVVRGSRCSLWKSAVWVGHNDVQCSMHPYAGIPIHVRTQRLHIHSRCSQYDISLGTGPRFNNVCVLGPAPTCMQNWELWLCAATASQLIEWDCLKGNVCKTCAFLCLCRQTWHLHRFKLKYAHVIKGIQPLRAHRVPGSSSHMKNLLIHTVWAREPVWMSPSFLKVMFYNLFYCFLQFSNYFLQCLNYCFRIFTFIFLQSFVEEGWL